MLTSLTLDLNVDFIMPINCVAYYVMTAFMKNLTVCHPPHSTLNLACQNFGNVFRDLPAGVFSSLAALRSVDL